MDGVLHDVVPKIIGFTVGNTCFYACSSHPNREATWVVISAEIIRHQSLTEIGTAKFAAPNNQLIAISQIATG
jgi:hypothetical protein